MFRVPGKERTNKLEHVRREKRLRWNKGIGSRKRADTLKKAEALEGVRVEEGGGRFPSVMRGAVALPTHKVLAPPAVVTDNVVDDIDVVGKGRRGRRNRGGKAVKGHGRKGQAGGSIGACLGETEDLEEGFPAILTVAGGGPSAIKGGDVLAVGGAVSIVTENTKTV